ncbi:sigma-70 family RNA polymerase sigma factor [Ketobacter sp.]|uniref:sigma-70 family RNA polymerase sigma factor n=1 Tax=Ketobacter sp. TaxID=2083498 RepID=UPI000F232631|nr:sigma-70 family RNA polymerase sigma factor [Ketobacter sp.]RLT94773.1 MAG: sigma-70 family RNA polymerase sigma factor [Ketobacter sp.]
MNRPVARRPIRAQLAEKNDEQLVAIARRQLPHVTLAYEVLMRRYQDALMRTCTRYLGSVHDAEEVVHEVMLKVFHGLARFKGESSFKTWLYRIAHNESMTWLRKRKDQLDLDSVSEDDYLATDQHGVERDVMGLRLERWINRLGPEDKSIVVYRGIAELEFKEIADIMDMSLSAVKMRYQRALDKLKQHYE